MRPATATRQPSPMYYCYQCNAEMRPLMVPDPHCESCNSTFVEEITSDTGADPASNPEDPRNFQQDPFGHFHGDGDDDHPHFHVNDGPFIGGPPGPGGDPIIHLMNMLMGGMPPPPQRRTGGSGGPTTIRLGLSNGRGNIIFSSGGGGPSPLAGIVPGPTGGTPGGASPRGAGAMPLHPLEGLLAMLGGGTFGGMGGSGMPMGQMGDYVLDQHSLDEIITRLMEQGQGSRPIPAPEDMIAGLQRQKVTAGSPLIEKECAVCKDTFEPSDNPVVTIACNPNPKYRHTFHEDCIVPWLKQNGTCPVCRFQLVPQPEHHAPPPGSGPADQRGGPGNGPPPGSSGSTGGGDAATRGASASGSGFSGFWDMFSSASRASPSSSNNTSSQRPSSPHAGSGSGSASRRSGGRGSNGPNNIPGAWSSSY